MVPSPSPIAAPTPAMAVAASPKGLSALANLVDMQTQESNRPVVRSCAGDSRGPSLTPRADPALPSQLSQVSWIPDVLRIRGSIIPSVVGPVFFVTLWAAAVATAQMIVGALGGIAAEQATHGQRHRSTANTSS